MKDALFYLALGALFTHELDAMPNHEWRGMPLLGRLADDVAMAWFVALHVPLFAGVIAAVASPDARWQRLSRLVVGGFIVAHASLHAMSIGNAGYEFEGGLSNSLIFGGALLGAGYLALELAGRGPDRA